MLKGKTSDSHGYAGGYVTPQQPSTPVGRGYELKKLLRFIRNRECLHIYGDEGTGKSAILDWAYDNWQSINTPLIPIYCRSSRTMRQILLCMATFLLDYFRQLESVDKFKLVKKIRYPSDIKTLSIRVLRNIVYTYISQGNFCIILDHLEYVTPKINGFINTLYDKALVITASRHSWELADYSFTGRLDYCLYLVPKIRLNNLDRKESFALMESLARNLDIGLPYMREMINESYRISMGNPRVISTIFEKAKSPKYRKNNGVNLALIVIDSKMSELVEIDGLRERGGMKNRGFLGLGKNVTVAGLVSFFMDISSEMIYPLVPLFLANVLGVNKSVIGLIEGVAESTASLLKVFSGWFSDMIGDRKWLMAVGYGISTLSRPLIALATGWHHVMGSRFIDRFGKGVRTAPRDAIIAESTDKASLGRAFGFHRSMDTMGAVAGPALAFFLLGVFSNDYRKVFWLSMIPGMIAVLLIIVFITEKKKDIAVHGERPKLMLKHFDWRFKFFMVIAGFFALGNSSDVFLILRAQQIGISTVTIPVVYLLFNLVYSLSAVPAGIAADSFGRKRVILLGFVLFAFLYYGFGIASGTNAIWILFGFYGLFMGLSEGVQKAFLTTIIPPDFKATAFGVYNTVVGLAMLPASLIGGFLWDKVAPSATFYFGAATATLSAIMFIAFIGLIRKNDNKMS